MANNLILDRLVGVKKRFVEVGELLTSPDVMSDMKRYIKLNKEYKELGPVVDAYKEYKMTLSNIDSAKDILAAENGIGGNEAYRKIRAMSMNMRRPMRQIAEAIIISRGVDESS